MSADILFDDEAPPALDASLFAPFPYPGNKRRAAPRIWEALGDVPNYISPFCGAAGDLFGRPSWHRPKIETINDLSAHIGVGFCSPSALRSHRQKLPHLAGPANPVRGQLPHLAGCDGSGVGYGRGIHSSEIRDDLPGFFKRLAARLRRVRCVTGDFERILTEAVTTSHGLTGVFLDPGYQGHSDAYEQDDPTASPRAREWALAHGGDPRFRIVLAGYEGEHEMPDTWRVVAWKSSGGSANAARERLWMSPHCQGGTAALPLFERRSIP